METPPDILQRLPADTVITGKIGDSWNYTSFMATPETARAEVTVALERIRLSGATGIACPTCDQEQYLPCGFVRGTHATSTLFDASFQPCPERVVRARDPSPWFHEGVSAKIPERPPTMERARIPEITLGLSAREDVRTGRWYISSIEVDTASELSWIESVEAHARVSAMLAELSVELCRLLAPGGA